MPKKEWIVAGLMSGTSLDGLDIAFCRFRKKGKEWRYEILSAATVPYSRRMKKKIGGLMKSSAEELAETDAFLGTYSGEQVKKAIAKENIQPDLIASHGHTVFHQPGKGFTTQIGNGAYISAVAGIPVVSDFRSMDVALHGQGAPLVPIGDKLLFGQYDYCLNLGGIANISFDKGSKRIAGDICPVNMVLNLLAEAKGKNFDKDGKMASTGKIDQSLLDRLNRLSFYKASFPKSLGREWVEKEVLPLLENAKISIEDKLATVCEHVAYQISVLVAGKKKKVSLLATGGGALNKYLIERLRERCGKNVEVVVPDPLIVGYKEALIFAFLGVKRISGEPNILSSVTGASRDSVGGALHGVLK